MIAFARASLRLRAVVAVLLVCAGITGATLTIRSDNLGFLQEWFGDTEQLEPGATAGSWSSRLIFAYVGMRIFLDHPIAGTGWYGELPPEEYARYLPDAHARYPDQPDNYFPPADGTYIPQQAPDQVLYQLGVIVGMLFLLLAAACVWTGVRAARRWPPGVADELGAYVPLTWTLAAAGGLAGTALFGGTPFNTLVWVAVGVAAAAPRLVERAR